MSFYIIIIKPFHKAEGNFINFYNELITVFSFFSVLIMTNYELPDLMINIWGWILSILVIGSLFITWYFILPEMLGQLKKTISNCFTKGSGKAENRSKKLKLERIKNLDKPKESERSDMKYGKSQLK